MDRQYLIPGGNVIQDQDNGREFLIPGHVVTQEPEAAGDGFQAAWAMNSNKIFTPGYL